MALHEIQISSLLGLAQTEATSKSPKYPHKHTHPPAQQSYTCITKNYKPFTHFFPGRLGGFNSYNTISHILTQLTPCTCTLYNAYKHTHRVGSLLLKPPVTKIFRLQTFFLGDLVVSMVTISSSIFSHNLPHVQPYKHTHRVTATKDDTTVALSLLLLIKPQVNSTQLKFTGFNKTLKNFWCPSHAHVSSINSHNKRHIK
jgi:hypothetical protein